MPDDLPPGSGALDEPAGVEGAGVDPRWLSEARYRAIVEDQPDLVVRFLPDGTLTFVNDAYCRFFDVRREDVLGRQYQPTVHPDDLERVQREVESLSPENPVVFIENRVFRGDGAVRWTEWTNRALYDAAGRLQEFQAAARDVTERRQASEATARLAAIVASADVAVYSTTLEGVITSWNRAAERMFGRTASEAVGQPIGILVPGGRSSSVERMMDRLRHGETVEHLETEKVTKAGVTVPVLLTLSPIVDAHGTVIGVSHIARDMTERMRVRRELEERESRFRLMADHAPVLIWIADTANRGVYFNRPWIEFTGVPLEGQLGDGWLGSIHPDDVQRAGAYCQYHFERRLPFMMEFRLRHHDGGYRWIQDAGQPLFLPDGTFNGYIGSCVDIEGRKQVEAAQNAAVQRESQARAAAEEASRLKDEFLAIVSHELRTPLNAILGWTRLLRDGTLAPDSIPKALETIERNARVQAQLVGDLLDVSRIVSGKLPLRVEPVELGSIIHAAIQAVHPAASAKGIQLQVQADSAEATVAGDPARLQQALWNLLVNAVKFTPKDGSVEVTLQRARDLAVVSVHDTGAGIPPDALPFIFDRFRQADSRTTRAHGGLGLGLAIVQYVAEAHGGSISVRSPGPGRGTTFELALPLPAGTAVPAPENSEDAERPDLTGRQILVVDDEPDVLGLMRTILEQSGADVITAGSVTEALGAVRTRCPDILVGDIGMPDQDGYDLIRLLRAMPECHDLRALAVTAYASPDHRQAALGAGYDAHLSKPVDPDRLCAAIGRLLPAGT